MSSDLLSLISNPMAMFALMELFSAGSRTKTFEKTFSRDEILSFVKKNQRLNLELLQSVSQTPEEYTKLSSSILQESSPEPVPYEEDSKKRVLFQVRKLGELCHDSSDLLISKKINMDDLLDDVSMSRKYSDFKSDLESIVFGCSCQNCSSRRERKNEAFEKKKQMEEREKQRKEKEELAKRKPDDCHCVGCSLRRSLMSQFVSPPSWDKLSLSLYDTKYDLTREKAEDGKAFVKVVFNDNESSALKLNNFSELDDFVKKFYHNGFIGDAGGKPLRDLIDYLNKLFPSSDDKEQEDEDENSPQRSRSSSESDGLPDLELNDNDTTQAQRSRASSEDESSHGYEESKKDDEVVETHEEDNLLSN